MEEFKIIKGTDSKYSISNLGNVKNNKTQRILKPSICHNGYLRVRLTINKKSYNKRIHRLVAEAFLPQNDISLQINHINEDKTDNRVENLEWCTSEYNKNYGSRNEKIKNKLSKQVAQCNMNGEIINVYESLKKASEAIGTNDKGSNISKVCRGKMKSYMGYKWQYVI